MTLHFLKDAINDAGSTQKIDHYIIFPSLRVKQLGKLIKYTRFVFIDIKFTRSRCGVVDQPHVL